MWIDTGAGPTQVPPADDLPAVAPVPPPSELLHTTYDMWHSMGIDLAPYTRLYEVMRDRILGYDVPDDPSRRHLRRRRGQPGGGRRHPFIISEPRLDRGDRVVTEP